MERPSTRGSSFAEAAETDAVAERGFSPALNTRVAPEVLKSLGDRDRLCPMLAGIGWVEGNLLTLRLPTGDLSVRAPKRLLKTVLRLCDGTLTFNEVIAKVKPEGAGELESFLTYLLGQGALIDAIFATQAAAKYAYQSVPMGLSAKESLTLRIGTRFIEKAPVMARSAGAPAIDVDRAPLGEFFSGRRSVYTFDERPVPLDKLASLLWSMGGVVSLRHPRPAHVIPHRTLGSGGAMYLVRWMLVLQAPVGEYGPGVYEVGFPGANQVSLTLRTADTRLLHRSYFKPWQLSHAVGAIFGIADASVGALRYRNRALQYLFMEAGAALQNMALSGPPLDIATAVIGGYCEDTARSLLGLKDEILVGSAIFGPTPLPEQERAVARMQPIDFVWSDSVNDIYPLPFHIARARPKGRETDDVNTWGKDPDPRLAYIKAHAEAVERQGFREPKNITVARMDEMVNPVHPYQLAAYSDAQYAQPGFAYKKFNERIAHAWAPGIQVGDGAPVSVLAQFIYGRKALSPFQARPVPCVQFNSSGCAAGTSLQSALQAGLLETIERDAFMRHWFAQVPGRKIPDSQMPAEVLARVKQMRASGCEVAVQSLNAVAAEVVLVSATHEQRHFTCVAAAARFDQPEACAAALDELETMVFTRLVGMDIEKMKPEDVIDPGGHSLLYAHKAYFRKASRVLQPTASQRKRATARCASFQDLCDALLAQGLRPSYVDITPERNCISQGRTALTVVKAVVPGLIPISFGYGREPRGMLQGMDPQSFFPHPFP